MKPSTLRGYRQMIDDYVVPALGDRPKQRLRTIELDVLYGEMLRGSRFGRQLSLGTVANVHRALHKALADAVGAGLAVNSPAARAKAPRPWRIQGRRATPWLPAELSAFLGATLRIASRPSGGWLP